MEQSSNTPCPVCANRYKMEFWTWIPFSFVLFCYIAMLVFAQVKTPEIPEKFNVTVTNEKTKKIEEFENVMKKISWYLFLLSGFGVALFCAIYFTPNEPKKGKCPHCKDDFPVTMLQLSFIGCIAVLPFIALLLIQTNYFFESNLSKESTCGTCMFALISKFLGKIKFVKIICILGMMFFVAFLIIGFWVPNLRWEKNPKENFFFEVSPERAKCLKEQVSRKNFGKPRDCSCCGRGTVGGIPPNYAQWLNVDEDTGSTWHRPDNVDYVQTFSNGEEATCNNCGPPSYKMYV